MKKMLTLLLAFVLVFGLCACGNDATDNTTTTTQPAQNGNTPMGYSMKIGDVTFGIGMNATEVSQKLGACEPFITESCGDMGGNDYEYDYQDYIIYANDGAGSVRIYCMEIKSDLVSTPENISIGDSAEDVKGAYGEPTSAGDTNMVYEKDGMQLIFILDGGEVTAIQYLEK